MACAQVVATTTGSVTIILQTATPFLKPGALSTSIGTTRALRNLFVLTTFRLSLAARLESAGLNAINACYNTDEMSCRFSALGVGIRAVNTTIASPMNGVALIRPAATR